MLAAISASLCQICISSTSKACRRAQIMLATLPAAGGLGGFRLDPVCVNLLVLSCLRYAGRLGRGITVRGSTRLKVRARPGAQHTQEHTQRARRRADADMKDHTPSEQIWKINQVLAATPAERMRWAGASRISEPDRNQQILSTHHEHQLDFQGFLLKLVWFFKPFIPFKLFNFMWNKIIHSKISSFSMLSLKSAFFGYFLLLSTFSSF